MRGDAPLFAPVPRVIIDHACHGLEPHGGAPMSQESDIRRMDMLVQQVRALKERAHGESPADLDLFGTSDLIDAVAVVVHELHSMSEHWLRLQECFDAAGVILVVLDGEGRINRINQRGSRLLGYERRELRGKDWFATCLPARERLRVRALFDRIISGGLSAQDVEYQNPVLCRDGTERLIAWHNAALLDGAGQVIGTISSGEDVTERKRAEQALRGSEARLHAVVNTAVDAIITIDAGGIVDSFNPAAERIFGYEAREVIGRNISMLMPSPYREQHDGYIGRYLTTGEGRIIGIGREAVAIRRDGTVFPVDLAVSEFTIGERRMFTGILRDITEQKRLAREVLEISTSEQQRIGHDLHDGLGQELTGIAFLADALKRSLKGESHPQAEAATEIVQLVNQAIDHTRALVRGLCPVGYGSEGLMMSLQDLAESVNHRPGPKCRFECPAPVMIEDHHVATHLYYIAHEATNNAIRHGKSKQIVISLLKDDSRITLSVADDGVGLPPNIDDRRGRGRHIMSYRARMIGATLEQRGVSGGGTVVVCSLHLDRPIPSTSGTWNRT